MTKLGWCFGPEGVAHNHAKCPVEVTSADGVVVRCGCSCHEDGAA